MKTAITKVTTVIGICVAATAFGAVERVLDSVIFTAQPASVELGVLESDNDIRLFREREVMVLPTAVTTDFSGSGLCGSAPGATIPSGTAVEVYMLHHDPVDSNHTGLTGSARFDGRILGVIYEDATLDSTDALLGYPGTTYPTGQNLRGLENCDTTDLLWIDLGETRLTLDLDTSTHLDQVRVLVEANACY